MKNSIVMCLFVLLMSGVFDAAKSDAGLEVPPGFKAEIFADSLGRARHIAVNENGDVYIRLRSLKDGFGMVALRDENKDGSADQIEYFEKTSGTGVKVHNGFLYYSSDTSVYRYPLNGELVPSDPPEAIITQLQEQRQHGSKTFTLDNAGHLYLNIGAPSNACQESMRTPGSPGLDPCPQLEEHGGVWRFDADRLNQLLTPDGYHFATGIRHNVAIRWNPVAGELYAVQHGRDQLDSLWPRLFDEEQNAKLPAEEFILIRDGSNFGWPYCYYDHFQEKKVLAPEYGGDGKKIGRCDQYDDPIMAFPAHWAPNDLLFYTGDQFPEEYQGGALIAFHGSWNRAPLPQQGYKVVFFPFDDKMPAGDWQVFANGFAGKETFYSTRDAQFRPMGLAQGPNGELYITDSQIGRVWRVTYDD